AESKYDHPFQWGSKRTGPDLARLGGKYPHLWHVRHMEDPRSTSPSSIMPAYPWLLTKEVDLSSTQKKVEAMIMLGVPYGLEEANGATDMARVQARQIALEIEEQGGPAGLEDKEIIALIAYMQRLGIDIKREQTQGGQP
ncbi:MAG: cbb3-type cytochrome c oxidase subunit II, partial [Bradymonadaceae bacterium]